jgi:hypothetical protein
VALPGVSILPFLSLFLTRWLFLKYHLSHICIYIYEVNIDEFCFFCPNSHLIFPRLTNRLVMATERSVTTVMNSQEPLVRSKPNLNKILSTDQQTEHLTYSSAVPESFQLPELVLLPPELCYVSAVYTSGFGSQTHMDSLSNIERDQAPETNNPQNISYQQYIQAASTIARNCSYSNKIDTRDREETTHRSN